MARRAVPDTASIVGMLHELGFTGKDAIAEFQRHWQREPSGALDRETIWLILDVHEAGQIGARQKHTSPCHAVKGAVTSSSGEAAPGLEVLLIEQRFRKETALGATKTDDQGNYELPYARSVATEKNAILVRVRDGKTVAAESAPQYTLPALLQIDLTVDPSHVHAPTEFEKLVAAVTARIGKTAIGDLQAADTTFLNGVTNAASDELVQLVVAHRLLAMSDINASLFYALLREGTLLGGAIAKLNPRFSIDLSTPTQPLYYDVVLLDASTIRTAVTSAVAARTVPAQTSTLVDGALSILAKSAEAAQSYYKTQRPQELLTTIAANVAAGKHAELSSAIQTHGTGDPSELITRIPRQSTSCRATAAVPRRPAAPASPQLSLTCWPRIRSSSKSSRPSPVWLRKANSRRRSRRARRLRRQRSLRSLPLKTPRQRLRIAMPS